MQHGISVNIVMDKKNDPGLLDGNIMQGPKIGG